MTFNCEECKDTGYVIKVDILNAKKMRVVCPKCHGIKPRDPLDPDGIRSVHVPAQIYLWQEFKNDKPIATLELWVRPITDNGKVLEVRDTPLSKPRPRIYISIRDMHTKPKYRKQGIMDRLLICAFQDNRVEWFETSWDDSTEEGRKFLLNRGFHREEDKLVFERQKEPGKN